MNKTSISWVVGPDGEPGYTWNPLLGCSPISAGCASCYAARLASTRLAHLPQYAGLARNGKWSGEVRFFAEKLAEPLRERKPAGVFVCDMGDLFHEAVTNEQIAAVFGVMAACPQHRFYLLTKRAKRMREWFEWVRSRGIVEAFPPWLVVQQMADDHVDLPSGSMPFPERQWPLPNVFVGTTIENQDVAEERIRNLLQTPAAVRFVSMEPLLGPVAILCPRCGGSGNAHRAGDGGGCSGDFPDLVIVGGESGPRARPCHVEWIRSIVRQCREAGVAPWVKQLGANAVRTADIDGAGMVEVKLRTIRDRAGADMAEWPADLRVREMPDGKR